MIKTPVRAYSDTDVIIDASGEMIVYGVKSGLVDDMEKQINMHDELVKSLHDMVEIVGSNFCQNMEIKRKYKIARELLERCK